MERGWRSPDPGTGAHHFMFLVKLKGAVVEKLLMVYSSLL